MKISLSKRVSTAEMSKSSGVDAILAGWVQDIRALSKINFIILRDREGLAQLVVKKLPKNLTRESVIVVQGKVQASKSCQFSKELVVSKLEILSTAAAPLPIDLFEETTELSKRLDWRFLDVRNLKVRAVFEIQTEICRAFREFFVERNFMEIFPPGIIAAAAEGGTDLFPVAYFEKKAYLAQSPQLYKQIIATTPIEKVFMLVPVWRAEKHNTFRHLNEARQMDIEVAFADQKQIVELLDTAVKYIVKCVIKNCKSQLAILGRKLATPKTKWLTYDEAIKALKKAGMKLKWGVDLGSAGEKKLAEIYGKNTLIHILSWPAKEKPFYIWPQGRKLSMGFDSDWGGIELTSGGQRVHDPKVLEKQIKAKGLNPKNFKFYIDAFRYGAPPHSGWSIGLERITMIICGLDNIREACMFPRDRDRLTP